MKNIVEFSAACGCYIGNGRNRNEDNFYFNKKHLPVPNKALKDIIKYNDVLSAEPVMFAVFDGMGGGSDGDIAAFEVCNVFKEEFKKLEEIVLSGKEFMLKTCDRANAVINSIKTEKQMSNMGSTVASLYFTKDEVVACNIGDSRIFRLRAGQMLQISEDHTDEKIMLSIGIQKKPVLLQYIGVPDTEMAIDPYVTKGDIVTGDKYLICSDGVTDALSFNELYDAVCDVTPEEAVRKIISTVIDKNGLDNATVIVVNIN